LISKASSFNRPSWQFIKFKQTEIVKRLISTPFNHSRELRKKIVTVLRILQKIRFVIMQPFRLFHINFANLDLKIILRLLKSLLKKQWRPDSLLSAK